MFECAIYNMYQAFWHNVTVTCMIEESKKGNTLVSSDILIPPDYQDEFVNSVVGNYKPVDTTYTRKHAIEKMDTFCENKHMFAFTYF